MKSATLSATSAAIPAPAGQARVFNDAIEGIFILHASDTTELLLIRHAEPDYDARNLSDDPFDLPLTKCGRWKAMRLATRLRNSDLDAVYTSPMRQSLETASVIAAGRDLPMTKVSDLREVSVDLTSRYGSVPDGRSFAWGVLLRYLDNPRWDALPRCEPSRQFRHWVVQAIEAIAAEHQGQRVALITHAGVINAYLSMILDISRDIFFMPDHTSISAVRAGDRYAVQMLNDASHLSRRTASI